MKLATTCIKGLRWAVALSCIFSLQLTARAATTFRLDPNSDQVQFNTHAGTMVSKTIRIQNTGSTPIGLGLALSGSPQFTLTGLPGLSIPGNGSQSITLNYNPLVAGSATGALTIKSLTGDSEVVQLSGSAIQSGLDRIVSPNDVSFNTQVGQTQCLSVNLTNQSVGAVTISNVHVTGDSTDYTVSNSGSNQIASGATGSYNVCFHPVTANGSARGTLMYTYTSVLDTAFHGTQSVYLQGVARGTANTADSMFFQYSGTLQYNNIPVGQQSCQPIRFSNPTAQTITIDSTTITGAGAAAYSVSGGQNLNIASGMTQAVDVCFLPTQAGYQNGVVALHYTTINNGSITHGTFYTNVYGNAVKLDSNGVGGESTNCIAVRRDMGVIGPILGGGSASDVVYLTNRTANPVTISSGSVTGGDSSAFSLNNSQFPMTLQSGQEVPVNVNFNPSVASATNQARYISQVVLNVAGQNTCGPITLRVAGVAVPNVDTSRFTLGGNNGIGGGNGGLDTMGFGGLNRVIGIRNNGSKPCTIDTVTFYNTTNGNVNVNNVYLPSSSNFTLLGTSMGMTYPITVASGGSLSTYIQFCANGQTNTVLQDQLYISTDQSLQPQTYNIQGIQQGTQGVQQTVTATSINFSIMPNPTAGQVSILVDNARSTKLEVFDILGNPVANMNGASSLTWDGRDNAGNQLANGTYIVRASGTTDQGSAFLASKHIVIEH